MKKLDLYIIRKFLGTFFFSLVLILCIVVVFDLSEKLEKFLENEAPVKAIVFDYYKNFIPYFANVFSSLFTFISVIFFTSKMAYDSEIIAILSTGISFRRFLFPYLMSATVIAILSFLLGAFIIPNANEKRIEFEKQYMGKRYANKEQNIHRQIAPGTYIYMSSYSVASNVGYDFSIENFRGDTLINKLTSSRITWDKENKKWVIHNWKLREIEGDKETYTTGQKLDTVMAFQPSEFSENPKKIREQLTFPELDRYIDRMKMRGLVDRVGDQGTHTEYSLEGVGTRTKVRDRTKVFEGVTLFLERVIRAGSAFNNNLCRLDLERLLCLRCCNESTFYDDGSADV